MGKNICLLMKGTQETGVGALGQEDPLEKEMAMHFPVFLSGKFRGQRRLAGYSPWDCKRVGHRMYTHTHTHTHTHTLYEYTYTHKHIYADR